VDKQLQDKITVVGASALGAVVVLGGAFWLIESAARRDALKIKVVTSLEPADRDLLTSIMKEAHIATSELSASLDRISERGIDLNFRPFGK
jgi:hypothetical protein